MSNFQSLFYAVGLFFTAVDLLGATGTVRGVHRTEPRAIIKSDRLNGFKAGDLIEIDKNCLVEIGKVAGDQALVNTQLCPNRSTLIQINKQVQFSKKYSPQTQGLVASALPATRRGAPSSGEPQTLAPALAELKRNKSPKPTKNPLKPVWRSQFRPQKNKITSSALVESAPPQATPAAQAVPMMRQSGEAQARETRQTEARETIVQPIIIQQPAQRVATRVSRPALPSPLVSKGLRVGIVKTFLKYETFNKKSGREEDAVVAKGNYDQEIGLSIGYASIPNLVPGFLGKATFNQYASGIESYRAEINGAVGVSRYAYFYLGMNANWFSDIDNLGAVPGYQAGIGIQPTPNLGFDVGYLKTTNRGKVDSDTDPDLRLDRQFELSGVEVSLHGTF